MSRVKTKMIIRKLYRNIVPVPLRKIVTQVRVKRLTRNGLVRWHEYLSDKRLYETETDAEKRLVFKKFVSVVHLEISSFCNRRCVYCTNSRLESRNQEKHFLTEELFKKCIDELSEINYCEFIEFNGFNEPLADRELFFRRASQLKTALPEAKLVINSNGDFLTPEYLFEIADADIDFMVVTLHLNSDELNISAEARQEKAAKFIRRFSAVSFVANNDAYHAKIKDMHFSLRVADFINQGHNFGGTVKSKVKRLLPCFVPVKHLYVDYAGRVNLCCSANMDSNEFSDFSIGNVSNANLFELYSAPNAQEIRQALITMSEKIPACCRCCNAQLDYASVPETMHNPYPQLFNAK